MRDLREEFYSRSPPHIQGQKTGQKQVCLLLRLYVTVGEAERWKGRVEMIRLLLGGSPCTKWSIAQKNGRETKPEGLGWDLFENYLIAKEKWKPDYFLYENNKSASQAIKDQIKQEFGVTEQREQRDIFDNGVRFTYINSALVSAQNRQRFYVTNFGDIEQPEDRGILLKDVIESGYVDMDKAYCLKHQAGNARDHFKKHHTNVAFKEVIPTSLVSDGKPIYEVKDGIITIKGKQYPIKLKDGYYIIRKLTVTECMRLQTVPEWYVFPVSDTQAYKMLGNGWTVEVIKHLLSHIPNITEEHIEVLSMYDGMSCGQIALKEMGCNVVKYYATEIDSYAIKTTQYNFPNTIQLGDAFQVRDEAWRLPI